MNKYDIMAGVSVELVAKEIREEKALLPEEVRKRKTIFDSKCLDTERPTSRMDEDLASGSLSGIVTLLILGLTIGSLTLAMMGMKSCVLNTEAAEPVSIPVPSSLGEFDPKGMIIH